MSGHVWYYIVGFGIFSWVSFLIAGGLASIGKMTSHVAWFFGVVGLCCSLIAGTYATATNIRRLVGWFIGLGFLAGLLVFAVVLLVSVLTVLAAAHDKIFPALALSLPLALVWIVLPSALSEGAVPGKVGATIQSVTRSISGELVRQTGGWFG